MVLLGQKKQLKNFPSVFWGRLSGLFTPLSTAAGSAALVARTLRHAALNNFTRHLINHRAPTASKAGAIATAHIGASSNPARRLFISLWQMAWQKVQEIRRWTALIASVSLQSLHLLCLRCEAQGLHSRKDFGNPQVASVLHAQVTLKHLIFCCRNTSISSSLGYFCQLIAQTNYTPAAEKELLTYLRFSDLITCFTLPLKGVDRTHNCLSSQRPASASSSKWKKFKSANLLNLALYGRFSKAHLALLPLSNFYFCSLSGQQVAVHKHTSSCLCWQLLYMVGSGKNTIKLEVYIIW